MQTRVAVMGIVVENTDSVERLNTLLHEYGSYIIGRMGIPYRARNINIVSIAIDAPQDVISALSGKIGRLKGVSAKMLTPMSSPNRRIIMLKIAVYGKGGIGKSTTVSNMAVALAEKGLSVMQIGCDPKADSTIALRDGEPMPAVLDIYNEKKGQCDFERDYKNRIQRSCLCGVRRTTPGLGCAGRGIITALEKLKETGAYEVYKPDVVLYDVLGDVVCGGFSMPMRSGYADYVFVVTSGEICPFMPERTLQWRWNASGIADMQNLADLF